MADTEHQGRQGVTDGLKTVSYARNQQGRIEPVEGDGWQPVNDVNGQAWREIDQRIALARAKVASGRLSCLYYHMVANQMTVWLLARYTRQSALTVLLHLLPFCFNRLPLGRLQTYADLFQVAADDLRRGLLPPATSPLALNCEPEDEN